MLQVFLSVGYNLNVKFHLLNHRDLLETAELSRSYNTVMNYQIITQTQIIIIFNLFSTVRQELHICLLQ